LRDKERVGRDEVAGGGARRVSGSARAGLRGPVGGTSRTLGPGGGFATGGRLRARGRRDKVPCETEGTRPEH
jgi:hypothetical protein